MSSGDPRLQFTELPLLVPSLNVMVQLQPVWNREPTICPLVTWTDPFPDGSVTGSVRLSTVARGSLSVFVAVASLQLVSRTARATAKSLALI
jgi:hypothetical protein